MNFSSHTLQSILDTWSYAAVLMFVGIESTGIPFPGETMLVVAAVYAGSGHLTIGFVIGAAAAGAIIGDNLGYLIGRTGGRAFILRFGKYIRLDERKLGTAERFFERHGDKTVFLGRFVAVLRAWSAFLAGLNRMPWYKFLLFNAAGGIVWSVLYGVLAYKLGQNLPLLHKVIRDIGVAGVVLAAVVILGALAYHFRHRLPWSRRPPAQATTATDTDTERAAKIP